MFLRLARDAGLQLLFADDLERRSIPPQFLSPPILGARMGKPAKWMVCRDDEHSRRNADRSDDAAGLFGYPARQRAVPRGAEQRDARALQQTFGGGFGFEAIARVG